MPVSKRTKNKNNTKQSTFLFTFLNLLTGLNRKYFLWGLFHHRISNRDDAVQDNHAVMDMEIDMVGGKCVGGTDMVVPKNLNYTTPQAVCRIKTESVEEPDFPPGFTPKARSKFAFEGTKFSDKMDILPGFEGRIRSSKLQGKFCSTDGKILSPQYIKKPIEDSVSADQPVRHQVLKSVTRLAFGCRLTILFCVYVQTPPCPVISFAILKPSVAILTDP